MNLADLSLYVSLSIAFLHCISEEEENEKECQQKSKDNLSNDDPIGQKLLSSTESSNKLSLKNKT